eukprot:Skav223793  [mRNA]  locus=scaffold575:478905:481596:+ [translate_table: standard]
MKGPLCVTLLALVALLTSENRSGLMLVLVLYPILGLMADSIQVMSGAMSFDTSALSVGVLPLWFLALWMNFGCVAEYLLMFRAWLAACAGLGAIFGPVAYLSGEAFKALEVHGRFGILMISLEWAICFPLLVCIADCCMNLKAGRCCESPD